jgi:uncharacterized protein (TIGR02246 family)
MKKLFMVLPLVFLLCLTFGCQKGEDVAEEPVVDVEADIESIKDMFVNNSSVINSGDLEGWIDQFTEDAVFMPPNSAVLKGKEAGREFARPWYEQLSMEFDLTVDEIEVHGNWAFVRWHYVGRYTPKAGGETIQDNGKEIWILKRQADGSWKCSHIIWNKNPALEISPEKEPITVAKAVKRDMNYEADIEAIRSLSQEISRTWNENDFEGWMASIDDDAMILLANGPTLKGIEEIRALYSNSFSLNSFDVTSTTEEIHVEGDIAFSRDTWVGSINPKDGGEPIVFDNKAIFIYKKQADGSWKIWRNIYNSNIPPSPPSE